MELVFISCGVTLVLFGLHLMTDHKDPGAWIVAAWGVALIVAFGLVRLVAGGAP